ncbi:MAG: hypothetical protein LUE99_01920 [Bacteroides sp.]|nr:hypothetical protein [Bacteroides sp.]
MYIALHPYFDETKTLLKYSQTELVTDLHDIKHSIPREVLLLLNQTGVDVNSIADIPSGTELGSSSSFTVGLLNALYAFRGKVTSAEYLAQMACHVEIDILKNPIGKQDQYAAAYGG